MEVTNRLRPGGPFSPSLASTRVHQTNFNPGKMTFNEFRSALLAHQWLLVIAIRQQVETLVTLMLRRRLLVKRRPRCFWAESVVSGRVRSVRIPIGRASCPLPTAMKNKKNIHTTSKSRLVILASVHYRHRQRRRGYLSEVSWKQKRKNVVSARNNEYMGHFMSEF